MKAALEEARQGLAEGGIPVGAVLVRDGQIIGRGHNQRIQQDNPILHGEMACLKDAGPQHSYRDTVLYSTLMPCFMCAGTVVQFRIPRVVVGEARNFEGAGDFLRDQGVEVVDLDAAECIEMLGEYIAENTDQWHGDIGER